MGEEEKRAVGPTPLQWFLAELDRSPGCDRTKARVRAILRGMAGQRLFVSRRDLVRSEYARTARALLDAGFTPTQARAELVCRFGFSHDSACRYTAQALSERAELAAASRPRR